MLNHTFESIMQRVRTNSQKLIQNHCEVTIRFSSLSLVNALCPKITMNIYFAAMINLGKC